MEGLRADLNVKGGAPEDWDEILSEGIKFSELAPHVAGVPARRGGSNHQGEEHFDARKGG